LPDAAARHLSEDLRGEAVLIRHAQVFSQGRPGVFLAVHAALLQEGNDLIDEVGDPVHGNVGNDAEPVSGVRPSSMAARSARNTPSNFPLSASLAAATNTSVSMKPSLSTPGTRHALANSPSRRVSGARDAILCLPWDLSDSGQERPAE
jgi:hypothetical protein